jgi:type VI secretion system protein ImpA
MTVLDVASLARPLSPDEPGGPDLDLEGDSDHLNFMARVEGALPTSFASFDRASIDFKSEIAAGIQLLGRTRDLRVLVLVAKLEILDRRLDGFASALALCAELLDGMWEDVHPKPMDGDHSFRLAVLLALDDMPHVVMPLQATPLFEVRRGGRVSLRHHLIASGAVQPREGEATLTAQQVAAALADLDAEGLQAALAPVDGALASLDRMQAAWARGGAAAGALVLDKLRALAAAQRQFLHDEFRRRNPDAVAADDPEAEADSPTASLAGVRTKPEADAALLGLVRYFAREEPSSLALMLLRQARQITRMSFMETLRLLLPDNYGQAMVRFGGDPGFSLPLDRIAEAPAGEDESEAGPESDESAEAEQVEADAWAGDGGEDEAAAAEGDAPGEVPAESETAGESALRHRPAPEPVYNVRSRSQANELLAQVATFFRTAEPSSPIPLLLDRARGASGRDFLALLQDVMPANVLRPPSDE